MRPILRKLVSAALAVAILAAPLGVRASDALGHDLDAGSTSVGAGAELAAGTFWSDAHSDLRQENYVVYTPNPMVTPVVTYGETTRALTTVPEAAQALEAQGWRVIAGINGDYFGMSHGVPLGSTMVNGALRNVNGDAYQAVGFRADGSAVIGDPKLSIQSFVNGGSGFPVFSFNHVRHTEYGICLYDHTFNDRHTTGTSEPGVDAICSVVSGALTIGGQLELSVDEVLPQATDTVVPEGKFVLTANLKAGEGSTAPLLALRPGDRVTVSVTSGSGDPAWNDVVNLIGAPELLVENSAVRAGLPTGSAPRTAIGQRADGSLILYTIDGRRAGYSIGASLTAVAMRLVELGCVTAVALDGGGSTTLVATMPSEMSARVMNTPSEALRPVSNHVFLVTPNVPSGIPDHLYLAPSAARALPGATVTLDAAVIDTNYIPMGQPVALRADAGTVVGSTLTLPETAGTVAVYADYNGLTASAAVAVAEPESIVVKRDGAAITSLTIPPDGAVTLTAQGVSNHLALAGGNECFAWSYEGDGVTLLPDGTLFAGGSAGAGTLTVSLGGKSVSIPVTVSLLPRRLLADYEAAFEPLADNADAPLLTLSRTTAASHVKLGKAAAKLEYKLDGENPLTVPVNYDVGAGYDRAELWVFGNEGSAALSLETDAGTSAAVPLSFSGWEHLSLALPMGAKQITGVTVSGTKAVHGTFLIDQLVLAYDDTFDAAAPELSLTTDAANGVLTGRAFDAIDGAALPTLRLEYDGAPLTYSFDRRTGMLTATLPAYDALAHQLTLTAGDASGNLARKSVYMPAAEGLAPAFPDVAGHWAAGAIEYLKRSGVSNGGDGGLYNPDSDISRQEFAVMLYRYLKPQGDFSGVEIPFADKSQIAPWALDAARAMYALGVIGGAKGIDGKLYYNPAASITRQEAMTMLGRLFERGYACPAPAYADSAEIAEWSAEQVALLASFGVFDDFVSDTLRPAAALTRAEMAAMLLRMR